MVFLVCMKVNNFKLEGLNLRVSPINPDNTDFIRLVNVDHEQIGSWQKRPGYNTYLNNPDNAQVMHLFDWHFQNGTQMYTYRVSGEKIYYSTQGTVDWAICGNGTITSGLPVGHTVFDGTCLMVGDGIAPTKHSTNGTSFIDTSGAPKATAFEEYQQRVYALGTSNNLTYSTVGTPVDWTTDSASLTIQGNGANKSLMKVANRLVATKTSKEMYRWDGYNLFDMSTKLGPSSDQSIAEIENYKFYLNQMGIFGFNGDTPTLVSNPIRKLIYNNAGSGIAGSSFNNAPGVTHYYDYLLSVGTVTDDFTKETISNCVLNYDFQHNHFVTHAFGTQPSAMLSYVDENNNQQLIFGDAGGQCYTYGGTATTDNGLPIQSELEFVFHGGDPSQDKKYNQLWLMFNPGCNAHVQIAPANTFTREKLKWTDLGDVLDGFIEYRFQGVQSKLLFIRIIDSSTTPGFCWYGYEMDFDFVVRR